MFFMFFYLYKVYSQKNDLVHKMSGCPVVHNVSGCPRRVWMSTMCLVVHSVSGCPHSTACLDVHNVSGCSQHVCHEGSHDSCEKNSWACKSIATPYSATCTHPVFDINSRYIGTREEPPQWG